LRDLHFKGMISIEYEANADEPTADVKACIEVFKQSVKKLPEKGRAGGRVH
jgi:hypothetical protein